MPRLAAFSLITDHVNTAEIYLLPPRLSYATILDPSWPCNLLSDGRAFHTGESRPQEVEAGNLRPLVAGAVDHRVEAATSTPHAPHKWLAASDRDSPGVPRRLGRLLLSKDRRSGASHQRQPAAAAARGRLR